MLQWKIHFSAVMRTTVKKGINTILIFSGIVLCISRGQQKREPYIRNVKTHTYTKQTKYKVQTLIAYTLTHIRQRKNK